jgi:hypothetical protein
MKLGQGSLTEGGKLRMAELIQLSLDNFLNEIIIYLCYKTNFLNEEVNCTKCSPSVVVLCLSGGLFVYKAGGVGALKILFALLLSCNNMKLKFHSFDPLHS